MGPGKDIHNGYCRVEVNVDDLGIDCVGNDSKEVRNLLPYIFVTDEFTILADLNAVPSGLGSLESSFSKVGFLLSILRILQVRNSRGILGD
jgi:hypothetical protein